MRKRSLAIVIVIAVVLPTLVVQAAAAPQNFGGPPTAVIYEAPEIKTVYREQTRSIELSFRVASGYHINSNRPKQEYLKRTELRLDAPSDIAIEKITYPRGEDLSFPFAPKEKLNVYTGEFEVKVFLRPLKTTLHEQYAIHGVLKYHACDHASCYPPKQLPVSFQLNVLKIAADFRRRDPTGVPE